MGHRWIAGLALLFLLPHPAEAQSAADAAILVKATAGYYNVHHQGAATFQCRATPDWTPLLAERQKTDPTGAAAALAALNTLRFTVTVAANGDASVAHGDTSNLDPGMASGIAQINTGVEQTMGGFFSTWSSFMMGSPIPAPGTAFRLQTLAGGYNLTYRDGDSDMATTMDKALAINRVVMTTPTDLTTIQPHFTASPDGMLLSAYTAVYRSQNAAEATDLDIKLTYQSVGGVQLPQTLVLDSIYGGDHASTTYTFSDCQVTRGK